MNGDLYCTFRNDGTMYMKVIFDDYDATVKEAVAIVKDKIGFNDVVANTIVVEVLKPYLDGEESVYYVEDGILYSAPSWDAPAEDWEAQPFSVNSAKNEATVSIKGQAAIEIQKVA